MQKGSALIILMLFLATIVLAITGSWYYINNQPQPVPASQTPYMPTFAPETQPSSSIYENPELNLNLKIPQEYTIKEETEEEFHKRSNGDMRKNFNSTLFYEPAKFVTSLYVVKPNQDPKEAPLSIWVFENPDNLTAAGFYKKYWYYPFIWGDFTSAKEKIAPEIEFIIGDATASSSTATYQPNSPKFIYLPKGDKMYLFKENEDSDLLKSLIFNL